MSVMVNVNGRVYDQAHAVIPVFDHGFLYGEGVYETLRTYDGEPFLFDRHMRRMRASAAMIQLPIPLSDADVAARFRATMAAADLGRDGREAYLRILVTRGVGELTYDPSACPESSVVIIAKPHVDAPAEAYEKGVTVALVDIVRNHPGSVNPLIKSNNLLNNALAMQEAYRRGAFEGVMRNYRGEIAECTTANLFAVKDGVVFTPPLQVGLLGGLTRELVFEIGRDLDVTVEERVFHDAELLGADEAFLTSTTREIVPIVRVDEQTIGAGVPGPVTRALLEGFRVRARKMLARQA